MASAAYERVLHRDSGAAGYGPGYVVGLIVSSSEFFEKMKRHGHNHVYIRKEAGGLNAVGKFPGKP